MAYAFSNIDKLVGEDDSGKQNIFGQDAMAGNDTMGGGTAPPPGSDMVKTTTEGEGSTGGGGEELQRADAPTPADQSQVFKANVGKTAAPPGISRISDKIKSNQDALQSSADAYTQQYKDDNVYDTSDETLNKAIGGDRDAYGSVGGLTSGTTTYEAGQFEGADDYYVDEMKYLGNKAGLQKLAGEGQGPRYSQGMGAFDVMLMQRDPNFTNLVNQVRGENRDLEANLDTMPDELEASAQEYGDTSLATAKDTAESWLYNYDYGVKREKQDESNAYNYGLLSLDKETIESDAAAKAQESVGADIVQQYGDWAKDPYSKTDLGGASGYVDYDKSDYTWQDFLDSGEAEKLNNVSGLLGRGDTYTEALGPRDQYTVDESGLYDYIMTKGELGVQDFYSGQTGSIDQIIADAQAGADADDERRAGLVESYDSRLNDIKNEMLIGDTDSGQYFTEDMMAGYEPRPGEQLDLGAFDVLNQGNVDELNALSQSIGGPANYQVGANADYGSDTFLDEKNFRDYLNSQLITSKSNIQQNQIRAGGGTIVMDAQGNPILDESGNVQAEALPQLPHSGSLAIETEPIAGPIAPPSQGGYDFTIAPDEGNWPLLTDEELANITTTPSYSGAINTIAGI